MALTRGDDFPIHQTAEPIAYAGTDRNFYDRYFFNGYSPEAGSEDYFAAAFGVYPHLNIADAAFVVVRDGVEVALHGVRCDVEADQADEDRGEDGGRHPNGGGVVEDAPLADLHERPAGRRIGDPDVREEAEEQEDDERREPPETDQEVGADDGRDA